MKALTITEIDAVCSKGTPMLKAMVTIAFRHGMRPSEVTGLLWEDVNLEERTITVRRLKNSLTTIQPMSEAELDALVAVPVDEHEERVFPVDRTTFFRWFQEAAKAAGLPKAKRHPHCLKHALGFALVAANVNMAVIKAALGHRSIASTAIYSVPTDEQVGKLVQEALR